MTGTCPPTEMTTSSWQGCFCLLPFSSFFPPVTTTRTFSLFPRDGSLSTRRAYPGTKHRLGVAATDRPGCFRGRRGSHRPILYNNKNSFRSPPPSFARSSRFVGLDDVKSRACRYLLTLPPMWLWERNGARNIAEVPRRGQCLRPAS